MFPLQFQDSQKSSFNWFRRYLCHNYGNYGDNMQRNFFWTWWLSNRPDQSIWHCGFSFQLYVCPLVLASSNSLSIEISCLWHTSSRLCHSHQKVKLNRFWHLVDGYLLVWNERNKKLFRIFKKSGSTAFIFSYKKCLFCSQFILTTDSQILHFWLLRFRRRSTYSLVNSRRLLQTARFSYI